MSPLNNMQKLRHQDHTTEGARKRVGKACDRCRLKKSKCDGSLPCQRCLSDDQICVFSERKRSKDKIYPKGYVELLESRTQALADAIHRLLFCQQQGIDISQLIPAEGRIVINDVLAKLEFLQSVPGDYETDSYADDLLERFIEDQRIRQNSVASDGAGTMSSSSSCHDLDSPVLPASHISPSIPFTDIFQPPSPEPAKLALYSQLSALPASVTPALLVGETGFVHSPLSIDIDYTDITNNHLFADVAWY